VSLKDLQEKWTPLHFACHEDPHVGVVKILLASGANLEAQDKVNRPLVLVDQFMIVLRMVALSFTILVDKDIWKW
jgi:hypothetical protein